jgi:hypothetical protein
VRAHWLDSTDRMRVAVAGVGRRDGGAAVGGEEGRG